MPAPSCRSASIKPPRPSRRGWLRHIRRRSSTGSEPCGRGYVRFTTAARPALPYSSAPSSMRCRSRRATRSDIVRRCRAYPTSAATTATWRRWSRLPKDCMRNRLLAVRFTCCSSRRKKPARALQQSSLMSASRRSMRPITSTRFTTCRSTRSGRCCCARACSRRGPSGSSRAIAVKRRTRATRNTASIHPLR